MAKLSFILALLLITFSYATIASVTPDESIIDVDIPTKKTLLLPSENEKPEETTTPVGLAEILPESGEIDRTEVSDMPMDRPMKIIRFHPINRHFPASRLGSLRVPRHRCHHDGMDGNAMRRPQRLSFGDDMMVSRPQRLSFGDDMMVAAGENGDFDPMVHGDAPERWIRIHRHHPHHLHRDGFPRGKHQEFFANKRFEEERDGEREEMDGREERRDGGFMRSVRKFLNGRF